MRGVGGLRGSEGVLGKMVPGGVCEQPEKVIFIIVNVPQPLNNPLDTPSLLKHFPLSQFNSFLYKKNLESYKSKEIGEGKAIYTLAHNPFQSVRLILKIFKSSRRE